jgi:PAS domain S-box-containing protein
MPKITTYKNKTIYGIYLIITLFTMILFCIILFFELQINALTAIRVYVGGEGLWAKAQKDAIRSLEHYSISHDEADYQAYLRFIQVPMGDNKARLELQKNKPDLDIAKKGFLQGRLHPEDIEHAITFFLRFQHIRYMAEAIKHWTRGDQLITESNEMADILHKKILSGHTDYREIKPILTRLNEINRQLTEEEDQFSYTLGEASRWANDMSQRLTTVIVSLLLILGITVSWPIIARIRATENALIASEERFRNIFNNAKDIVFTLAPDATFTSLNPAFETMTGWKQEEWLNKPFAPILHPDDLPKAMDIFKKIIQEEATEAFELNIKKKSGEYFIGEYTVTLIRQGNGTTLMGIIRDVTERKKIENALRESEHQLKEVNAAKDKFFSIIAHDLKNPFNALLGSAQTLHENTDNFDKDDIKNLGNIIYKSSKNAYNLIENLLEWAKSQLGRIDFQPHDVNLRDIAYESIQAVANQAQNKNVVLINDIESIPVYADPNLLKTILRNLLSNAIKYTDGRGNVTIRSKLADKSVEISVADTGVGMLPEIREKLFQIDTKYSTPGTAKETGTGLGLILCKEFVEKHGGKIWVESEVGKGTTFTFTLPTKQLFNYIV